MKERFILAPGCNGTELLRTLAEFGVNTMGVRVVSAAELAKTALNRSGISITETYISRSQEASLVAAFLCPEDFPYFASASYTDAVNLADALYSVRSLITGDEKMIMESELAGGEFPEKNRAILSVYKKLESEKKHADVYDDIDLIRKAIADAKELSADFLTLEEYPLSPLEKQLLNRLSGGTFDPKNSKSVPELFAESGEKKEAVLTKAYGASNEAEDILSYIFINEIPLDKCTVAVTDAGYSQLFYEMGSRHGIPITFGNGIAISNTNPARLLKALVYWEGAGFYGETALNRLVFGDSFNRKELLDELKVPSNRELKTAVSIAGRLRLGRIEKENREKIDAFETLVNRQLSQGKMSTRNREAREKEKGCIPFCRRLSDELCKAPGDFILKYSVIRKNSAGRFDAAAVRLISQEITEYFRYFSDGRLEDIAKQIYARTVGSENRKEGALFVTGIKGALAGVRSHLFIAGLSADVFPGKPKENYLILDKDYEMFAEKDIAPTSINRVLNNRAGYEALRKLGDKLGLDVRLSFSGYELADLKEKNPSSVVREKVSREVGYFESKLEKSDCYGKEYLKGTRLSFVKPEPISYVVGNPENKSYSPTVIEEYFKCPRKFMLNRILGLPEPEEDNPMEVMDAKQFGSLVHSAMELQTEFSKDKEKFREEAKKLFDDFILEFIPVQKGMEDKTEKKYLKMVSSAFDEDPGNTVEKAEERIEVTHECGLKLGGYPDRVEQTKEGNRIIPDFKTGKTVKHKENDIDTCIQVAIYAYIMEKNGTPISKGEYRYLALQKVIPFIFDGEAKEKLDRKISEFKTALDKGDFPCRSGGECGFCYLSGLCSNADRPEDDAEAENENE